MVETPLYRKTSAGLLAFEAFGLAFILALGLCACKKTSEENSQPHTASKSPVSKISADPSPADTIPTQTTNLAIASPFLVEGGPSRYLSIPLRFGSTGRGLYLQPEGLLPGSVALGMIAVPGASGLHAAFRANLARFVARGWSVLALDLYNGRIPSSTNEASAWQKELNAAGKPALLVQLIAAADYLGTKLGPSVPQALVGWDQGGVWAMSAVLAFPQRFQAMVNYYGSPLELFGQVTNIGVPMLHFYGRSDPKLPITSVIKFEAELRSKGVEGVTVYKFSDVAANFLEPKDINSTQDSENVALAYKRTLEFLEKVSKK